MLLVRRLSFRALVVLSALLSTFALLGGCGGAAPPRAPSETVVVAAPVAPVAVSAPVAAEDDLPLPIAADDPVRGDRLAPVTLVVFSDFQCPFCGRHATTLEQVQEAYGADVRIVFKQDPLPFHPYARLAAEVGSGVFAAKGAEAFWRYHDMAFRRQKLMSPETIRAWAVAAGMDPRALEDGLARKVWSPKVTRDLELASRVGANGTPATFVNGVLLSGAQPFDAFKSAIDKALQDAKDLASQGVTPDRIYARAVTTRFESPTLRPQGDEEDEAPDTAVWKVPVGKSPVRGSADALVTIVEFSDFQCPYCKKVQPALERLRSEYGDRLRIVWKDEPLPFHPRALPAANLARAARAQKGDAGFWAMHDLLFAAQPALEDSDLEGLARKAGLDAAKAMAAVRGKTFAAAIDADASLGDDVQASGTPHFFINGKRIVGAQPYEKLKAMIDGEITLAEAMVRGGVKPAALYDAIIKDGKSAPPPERKVVAPSATPAPFRGADNAKVVIVEFSDFQCPFCSRVEPTLTQLIKDYPGKVKVVWRNNPLAFHADAELAAEAAREAFVQKGNEGFSKMRELLFKHQGDVDGLKRTQLESYAAQVGLDAKKFGKALDDGTHKAAIAADKKAATDAGMSGTPAFLVGPYALSGAQPLNKFKKLVDRVLSESPAPAPAPAPRAKKN